MNKAILIQADDWEGLFVEGVLIQEGHTLNEGSSRVKYFSKLSKQYEFNVDEMKEIWIDEKDEDRLYSLGSFPAHLSELYGNYDEE